MFFEKKAILIWFCKVDSLAQNYASVLRNYFSFPGKHDFFKQATKLFVMHNSVWSFFLLSTGLRKPAFSTYTFGKIVFCLSVFCVCSVF